MTSSDPNSVAPPPNTNTLGGRASSYESGGGVTTQSVADLLCINTLPFTNGGSISTFLRLVSRPRHSPSENPCLTAIRSLAKPLALRGTGAQRHRGGRLWTVAFATSPWRELPGLHPLAKVWGEQWHTVNPNLESQE